METNILKQRSIYNYYNNTSRMKIPKFYTFDERGIKCNEILSFNNKFDNSNISFQIKNFYDQKPCFFLRSLIYTKMK